MLCNICSRINLDELVSEEGMKHHKIFIDLFNAAKAGCPLCEAVFEDHEGSYQNDDEDHEANFDNYEEEVVDYAHEESDFIDLKPELERESTDSMQGRLGLLYLNCGEIPAAWAERSSSCTECQARMLHGFR